jgi:serine/threonine-protein kinase
MAQSTADRDLLLGVLALQGDFLGRDQLRAALESWLHDRNKPLGQVLRDQGQLTPERRRELDALVEMYLKPPEDARRARDGSPAISTVSEGPGGGADPGATGPFLGGRAPAGGPETGRGNLGSSGLRYRVLRPHARGGLGEVFVALDEELHREVALKEIQEQHAQNPSSRGRFVLEAELTGGLEHPGIVPVYGFGHYPDGRPYYAMRFIQGETLHDALRRFHEAEGLGRDPGERTLALRELLGRFIDVCNAVAYAHSRGVVHRDLKPGNIMLGKYGETLLVDWGLAKVVGRPESAAADEQQLRPRAGAALAATQVGVAVGTPAYMSPEQAAGRLEEVGPASDVYSLGATLYALLAGVPPFRGEDPRQVVKQVQGGAFTPLRQVSRTVPPALEAICHRAMALRPEDRYPSPRALADDLKHWMADEPVSAWREPWAVRCRRWLGRHRTLVTAAAAVLVASTAILTAAAFLLSSAYAREHRAKVQVQEQRDRARTRFEMARGAVDEFYIKLSSSPEMRAHGLERLRQQLLEGAVKYYRRFVEEESDDPGVRAEQAESYLRMASLTRTLGRLDHAEAAYQQGRQIAADLAARYPDNRTYARAHARAQVGLGGLYQVQGKRTPALESFEEALRVYRRLREQFPEDIEEQVEEATGWQNVGLLYLRTGRPDLAEQAWIQGRDLRARAVAAIPNNPGYEQDLAQSYSNLGSICAETGRRDEAEKNYLRARDVFLKLSGQHPDEPSYQNSLGNAYHNLGYLYVNTGRAPLAGPAYEESMKVRRRLAETHPLVLEYQRNLAFSHSNLGDYYSVSGRHEAAVTAYQESRKAHERLVEAAPRIPEYQQALAANYHDLGRAYRALGQFDQAEKAWKEARDRLRPLTQSYPEQHDFRSRLAEAYNELGVLYLDQGRYPECEEAWHQALALQERLAKDQPQFPDYRRDLAGTEDNLGVLYRKTGRMGEALRVHQKARADFQQLVDQDPRKPLYRQDLAECLGSVGLVYLDTGRPELAEAPLRERLEMLEQLNQAHPGMPLYQVQVGDAASRYAEVLRLRGELRRALDQYTRVAEQVGGVLRKEPKDNRARSVRLQACCGRALTLARLGRAEEARAALAEAARLPDAADDSTLVATRVLVRAALAEHREVPELAERLARDRNLAGHRLYELARGCAVARQAADQDSNLPAAEKEAVVKRLAGTALEFLRRAEAVGYFQDGVAVQRLMDEADFVGLRSAGEFKDLVKRLQSLGKGPAEPQRP